MLKKWVVILAVPAIFLAVSLVNIKDYGISWDEPIHFYRGQAYLYYFLTGEETYENLEDKVTYYRDDTLPPRYWLENDSGHPPLNGILSALTNYIFYQKLGILGDIYAHHLFNILSSTLLVFIVSVFAYQTFGIIAGVLSGLALSLYPLFLAESQFNIKDPPEAAFFGLTIWTFWMSLKKGNWKWLLASVVAFSLALGTKFNIVFLPFILIPYLIIRYKKGIIKWLVGLPMAYKLILFLSPLVVFAVFVGTWPFLWQDLIGNFLEIVGYYKEIGTGTGYQPGFFLENGVNTYPIFWILITTPPVFLLLTLLGIVVAIKNKRKDKVSLLWLIWFIIPITRVTVPNTTVYGGIRQIMEYVPAMALLVGLGASWVYTKVARRFGKVTAWLTLVVLFIPALIVNMKLHPNQNVYFNFFIGGLSGAKEKNIPYWGNSFGNAYWQGIQWLNENAEANARLSLIQGTALNIPSIMLREDITRWNNFWSGIKREGEYLIELTHQDPNVVYPYAWDYVNRFLDPVYEVKVDGVAIAKIWKNDLEHTKAGMRFGEVEYKNLKVSIKDRVVTARMTEQNTISRLSISFDEGVCGPVSGYVESRKKDGSWYREIELVPSPQISDGESVKDGQMNYFFPGRTSSAIRYVSKSVDSCIFNNPDTSVYVLE